MSLTLQTVRFGSGSIFAEHPTVPFPAAGYTASPTGSEMNSDDDDEQRQIPTHLCVHFCCLWREEASRFTNSCGQNGEIVPGLAEAQKGTTRCPAYYYYLLLSLWLVGLRTCRLPNWGTGAGIVIPRPAYQSTQASIPTVPGA
jgi:hypothetical protein